MHRVGAVIAVISLVACAGAKPAVVDAPAWGPPTAGHQEGHFPASGGVNLYAQSWRPPGTPRATVVIIHGLKDHSNHYAEVAGLLVQHGYAVYGMDLRGHGQSPGDRVWVDSFSEYVDDLDAFMKWVREREPGRPVFLFGHSMGGQIVTSYAIEKQPELAGLILSGPALKVGSDVSGFLIGTTKALSSVTPGLGVLDLKDENFSRDPKVVAAMAADPLIYHKAGPARTAAELLRQIEKTAAHFEDVKVPLLDMHGSKDVLTNPEGSKELVARAASKDKTLKIYDGLFHDLLHEPEKAQVQSDMIAWIEARTPAAAH